MSLIGLSAVPHQESTSDKTTRAGRAYWNCQSCMEHIVCSVGRIHFLLIGDGVLAQRHNGAESEPIVTALAAGVF